MVFAIDGVSWIDFNIIIFVISTDTQLFHWNSRTDILLLCAGPSSCGTEDTYVRDKSGGEG